MSCTVTQPKNCPRIVGCNTESKIQKKATKKAQPQCVDDVPTICTGTTTKPKGHNSNTVEPGTKKLD